VRLLVGGTNVSSSCS